MQITLFNNTSEKNKINKSLNNVATLTGSVKENASITHPEITIEYSDPISFNYCYIDAFNRYYFVDDVIILRNNIMRLKLTVDVLMSFANGILNQNVIVIKNTNNYNLYLLDENLKTLVKTTTTIVNFPNGLNDNGEFVLITAGG